MAIRTGSRVRWRWGSSWAEGTVSTRHTQTVTRTTQGAEVTRNGSEDDPAYEITQDDGTLVLKLRSEVEHV